jgi:hypothetical protein
MREWHTQTVFYRLINILGIPTQPCPPIIIRYIVDKVYEDSWTGSRRIKRLDSVVDQKSGITFMIQAFCYICNTASDSDGFQTGFQQQAQPLSTFHFLSISNILLHFLTVAYSQPSVIAPIPT